jgi:hypothetical protein
MDLILHSFMAVQYRAHSLYPKAPAIAILPQNSEYVQQQVQPLALTWSTAMCILTSIISITRIIFGGMFFERSHSGDMLTNVSRNLGIMFALMTFGCFVYLVATEFISAKHSKGEVFLFRRNHLAAKVSKGDEEAHADDRANVETLISDQTKLSGPAKLQHQTDVLHWESVNYDIKVKDENKKTIQRRLLEDINGWVRPGTMTALMVCISFPDPTRATHELIHILRGLPEPVKPRCLTSLPIE